VVVIAPPAVVPAGGLLRTSFTHGGGDQLAQPFEPKMELPATPDSEFSASVLPRTVDSPVLPGERLGRPPKDAFLAEVGDEVDPEAQLPAGVRAAALGESLLDDGPDVKHFEQALASVRPDPAPVAAARPDEPAPTDAPALERVSLPTPPSAPASEGGFSFIRAGALAVTVLGAAARAGALGGLGLAWLRRRRRHDSPDDKGFFARWFSRND
jgi:hypothetical protein